MVKLPLGVNEDNLINDLRILSWEASEVLLHYAKILKDSNFKSNILANGDHKDPVTLADLEVNNLIIEGIQSKYKDVDWTILSEENVKISNDSFGNNANWSLDHPYEHQLPPSK